MVPRNHQGTPQKVALFCDGAWDRRTRNGGIGVVLRYGSHVRTLAQPFADTTSQRMELQAAITGLHALTRPCRVDVLSDSRYLVKGAKRWLANWQRFGWQTRSGTPVTNRDLWEQIAMSQQIHTIRWRWIPGHSGIYSNEMAHTLARAAVHPPPR